MDPRVVLFRRWRSWKVRRAIKAAFVEFNVAMRQAADATRAFAKAYEEKKRDTGVKGDW